MRPERTRCSTACPRSGSKPPSLLPFIPGAAGSSRSAAPAARGCAAKKHAGLARMMASVALKSRDASIQLRVFPGRCLQRVEGKGACVPNRHVFWQRISGCFSVIKYRTPWALCSKAKCPGTHIPHAYLQNGAQPSLDAVLRSLVVHPSRYRLTAPHSDCTSSVLPVQSFRSPENFPIF